MGDKNALVIGSGQEATQFADKNFKVSETISHLQHLMVNVTKKELNADTVNVACNYVQNLNLTIKTAIEAAKFIKQSNR